MRQVACNPLNQHSFRDFHAAVLASIPKIRKMFIVLVVRPKPVLSRVLLCPDTNGSHAICSMGDPSKMNPLQRDVW